MARRASHSEEYPWSVPLSEAERTGKRGPGVFGPPDRMCSLCFRSMPPVETSECCIGCKKEHEAMRSLLSEIRRTYPSTKELTASQIFKRLWEKVKGG